MEEAVGIVDTFHASVRADAVCFRRCLMPCSSGGRAAAAAVHQDILLRAGPYDTWDPFATILA